VSPRRALLAATLGFFLGLTACAPPDHELSDVELYRRYCADCHGEDYRGEERYLEEEGEGVDLLTSKRIRRGDRAFVHRRMAYGYGAMPAFERELAPEDFQRLVDFIMALPVAPAAQGEQHGPEEDEGGVPQAPGAG